MKILNKINIYIFQAYRHSKKAQDQAQHNRGIGTFYTENRTNIFPAYTRLASRQGCQ